MRLFIAEKPDLAKAICEGLGGGFAHKDGYMVKGDDTITWCFGHMLTLFDPDDYDEQLKDWSLENLPFVFLPAKRKYNPKTSKQTKIIRELLEKADTVVNAGDPDEEGQLLVDELIRHFNCNKPVQRVLINDNNTKVVAKAIANMKPNSEYEHLGFKAEARSIADWAFGLNLTRAYTKKSQLGGGQGVLSIGRVQTPILGLVVRRDREHKAHTISYYYNITGQFNINGTNFKASYQPTDQDSVNDSGKIIDKAQAQAIAAKCSGQSAVVLSVDTKEQSKQPPLPYNLLKLQQDASRKFGLKPDQTLSITQSLREKYKLITYNRSDCQYLSDEQFDDAGSVLDAISQTAESDAKYKGFASASRNANASIKGRVFNSAKVSAHHAIIPTETIANLNSLSESEKNIYLLIARYYIAQFYSNHIFDATTITIEVAGHTFKATGKVDKELGWVRLFSNDKGNEEAEEDSNIDDIDLRQLSESYKGQCVKATAEQKETQPPALYTMTTLLGDLTKVAKYVKNPQLAKILKEKDKDKAGEHGGIGTPATRSTIIKKLFERGYLIEHKKKIISTPLGQKLYDSLDDLLVYPDMTAKWHEQQKNIQTLDDAHRFVHQVMTDVVVPIVKKIKSSDIQVADVHKCPKCGRPMRRITSGKSPFWGCTGYNATENTCDHKMADKGGKPIEIPKKEPVILSEFACTACGSKLVHRKGKSKKTKKSYSFFACSNYPACKQSYYEKNGEPVYDKQ